MKNKLLKISLLAVAVFALGVTLLSSNNQKPQAVYAEQAHNPHPDNFSAYTYSGNYYSSIDSSLTGGLHGTLRKAVTSLIFPKKWYTYSGSSTGTLGKILQDADQDPLNSSNMSLFYTRDSISKRAAGGNVTDWNREHVWPQNLSNGHWGKNNAGADLLHIRPTWSKTNSTRSDTKYGDNNKSGPATYEGMLYAYTNGSYFEPIDSVKGDVARILMYVWTAYYDYYSDSSLLLTKVIQSYDVLIKWHTLDKPDVLEGNRNNFSQNSDQKNRNPFVDHPEYAWKIFGDQVSASVKADCMAAYPGEGGGETPPPSSSSSSLPPANTSSIEQSSSAEDSSSVYSNTYGDSSETNNSSSDSGNTPKKNTGCGGSVVAILPISGFGIVVSLVFVLSKKKKK